MTNPEKLKDYSHDYTEDISSIPDIVLMPETTQQVSKIMQYCYDNFIPVTPRGAGTGLSGGAIPVKKGVVLSLEKMNKILKIDVPNRMVITQPGVITQVLQEEVQKYGLFYPPDPASRGSCFIGGNVAENSGGPKAVKYGVTKDYVLDLEVVLPCGTILHTGAATFKNATGYNLTQLFVGSEGTLGIVTEITLKLLHTPKHDVLMMIMFDSLIAASRAVNQILQTGILPSALELMEKDALDFGMQYIPGVEISLPENTEAVLLVELDGNYPEILQKEAETIAGILENNGVIDIYWAEESNDKQRLWKLRRGIGEAVKMHSVYKEEDTVVPVSAIPELIEKVKDLGKKYGFRSVCYGHAGDGNIHVNILKDSMREEDWNGTKLEEAIRELFRTCKRLGGTISGEHGIGLVQKKYLKEVFTEEEIEWQKKVKILFDPRNILNPGKIFPD
ncbi:MAG: dehydrogenase [Vicingaceae bacterium]|nr:MAG: dehydrogenase [Vicingaceae bacterium]